MKLSIDKYLETGAPVILPLHHGKWAGQSVAIDLEVCADPTCDCAQVDFHCRPFQGVLAPADDAAAVVFALDVSERLLCDPETGSLTQAARALGKAVMAELEEEDWPNLFAYLALVKQEIMKTADLTALDVEFPPEVMDGDDSMVGYGEIFPYASLAVFELGGYHWDVTDQYCLDPDCDCTSVRLTFVGLPKDPGAEIPDADDEMPTVLFNYGNGRIEDVESNSHAGQPAVESLLQAARAGHPAFDREVRTRHLLLRGLFLKARFRAGDVAVPLRRAAPKIGRNDPCPCGSGEKYKKCCATQDDEP